MRDGGRIAAALEVLQDFSARRVPLKVCLADWARGARFAGSKDRAFISGLALEVLRHRRVLEADGAGLRGAAAIALHRLWEWPLDRVTAAFAEEPHGPGALDGEEVSRVTTASSSSDPTVCANMPDFVLPLMERTPGLDGLAEGRAFAARAPTDLRVNRLKTTPEKALAALEGMGAELAPFARDGLRLPPPPAAERGKPISAHPAFQKGLVEIQDEASQMAALAAYPVAGQQVFDYCAGGGGKTLALAAMMENSGQLYAYDADPHRLAPLIERARRAGVRNLQVISPLEADAKREALEGKMDVVFVDAPCSGIGTWRRHPDTKWRLTEQQLETRMAEQDRVLAEAAPYVRPGGTMIYVTCSLVAAENEERVDAFLANHPDFTLGDAAGAIKASDGVRAPLPDTATPAVRFSPHRTATDGFTITRLERQIAK